MGGIYIMKKFFDYYLAIGLILIYEIPWFMTSFGYPHWYNYLAKAVGWICMYVVLGYISKTVEKRMLTVCRVCSIVLIVFYMSGVIISAMYEIPQFTVAQIYDLHTSLYGWGAVESLKFIRVILETIQNAMFILQYFIIGNLLALSFQREKKNRLSMAKWAVCTVLIVGSAVLSYRYFNTKLPEVVVFVWGCYVEILQLTLLMTGIIGYGILFFSIRHEVVPEDERRAFVRLVKRVVNGER